jgi:hypothetical protein
MKKGATAAGNTHAPAEQPTFATLKSCNFRSATSARGSVPHNNDAFIALSDVWDIALFKLV